MNTHVFPGLGRSTLFMTSAWLQDAPPHLLSIIYWQISMLPFFELSHTLPGILCKCHTLWEKVYAQVPFDRMSFDVRGSACFVLYAIRISYC